VAVQDGSDLQALFERLVAESIERTKEKYGDAFSGEGRVLECALDDAYDKGKAQGYRVFQIEDIFLRGDNPLSGYAVVLGPHA
jgi:hypothetical protein